MSQTTVKDYLNTQGLRLPIESVQMAYLTLSAVYNVAQVESLPDNLWAASEYGFDATKWLPETPENNAFLRSVFAVLDSCLERFPAHVAVYAQADARREPVDMLRLERIWHQAPRLPTHLNADEHGDTLAHRCAQTGWAYVVEDAQIWFAKQELNEAERRLGSSQLVLPLCSMSGRVLGVLYVTSPEAHAWSEDAQVWWVAAALVLADALYTHFPTEWWGTKDEDDLPA